MAKRTSSTGRLVSHPNLLATFTRCDDNVGEENRGRVVQTGIVSNMNTPAEMAKILGSNGGKKSAEARLGGKTREERSEVMRQLVLKRYPKSLTKEQK